jgi:hypothetical protein
LRLPSLAQSTRAGGVVGDCGPDASGQIRNSRGKTTKSD